MSKKYAICFSLLLVAGVARSQTRNQLFLSAVEKENIQHHSILCDTTDHRFCLVAISPDEKALFDTNSVEKTFQLNDSLSETVTIHFTSLPIIHIQSENISTEFSNGHFLFYDPTDSVPLAFDIDVRWRGATTLARPKKSYAVKLKDAKGEKLNHSFLGLRSDNSWILDAMSIDKARMRNRISTDLWNDFSTASYIRALEPTALNGTRGQFVEVFYNHRYQGVYCMTEKIDRKQLQLRKFKNGEMRGVLYKTNKWNTLVATSPVPTNAQSLWNGIEISYPNLEDGEPVDWSPLLQIMDFLTNSSASELRRELPQRIDLDVWRDYFLFIELLLAEDNDCKNQCVYFYDATNSSSLFGIAPWDLDHSWGRDYQGNALEANKNFLLYNRVHTCLRTYYGSYNYVKERYQELRTNELRTDSLKARFHRVFQLYRENQVDEREELRWNGQDDIVLDFDAEEEYIQQWIDQRLAYLDAKYDFDEELDILQTMASASPYYTIRISKGMLHIQATKTMQLQVSNLQGNDVYRKNMQEGESVDLPLPCGIYLVNKAKLFVP
jgi:spore coat protein CotH